MVVGGLCLVVSSCDATFSDFAVLHREGSVPSRESRDGSGQVTPQTRAALQLTDQGRNLLESGNVDDAITAFERSISLNPSNGENYYYLAEAWIRKGNVQQAREFNQLAGLHLESQRGWMDRVAEQRQRIDVLVTPGR